MADPTTQPSQPQDLAANTTNTTNVPQSSSTLENEPELDVDLEMADDPPAAHQSSSTLDHEPTNPAQNGETHPEPPTHPPSRKDASLRDFLSKMDDYAPIIPDAVTAHYLTLAGLPPPSPTDPSGTTTNSTPLPLARLLALATQKFISDMAADAYQYARIRASHTSAAAAGTMGMGAAGAAGPGVGGVAGGPGADKNKGQAQLGVARAGFGGGGVGGSGQGRTVLTMEDLGMAVQEYGVNVRRGEFYR